MQNEKRYFNKGINADDDFDLIGPGEYINGHNMRFGTTDTGAVGNLETIGGTDEIKNPYLPAGTNLGIGGCEDTENRRIVYCNYNSQGSHAIYCHDKKAGTIYKVLTDTQVEGGLKFGSTKDYRIHSCKAIDGLFIYTDNNSDIKCVSIDAGIKLNHPTYVTVKKPYTSLAKITLIKKPPIYRLEVLKTTDAGFPNNLTYNNAYQFRYQYLYKDNLRSVVSTFSERLNYNLTTDTFNAIEVKAPFAEKIDDYVQEVLVWVKNLNTGKSYLAKRFDKDNTDDETAIFNHNAGTAQLGFTFYDNIERIFLNSVDDVTHSDGIPLLSKSLEVAKNRLLLANNLLGYNTPKKSSLTVELLGSGSSTTGTYNEYAISVQVYGNTGGGSPYQTYNIGPKRFLNINDITVPGYYTAAAFSPTTAFASLTLFANDFASAAQQMAVDFANANGLFNWSVTGYNETQFGTIDVTGLDKVLPAGAVVMNPGSSYKYSIYFMDDFKRRCGYVDIDVNVNIPERSYTDAGSNSGVMWKLSNANALYEIPVTAKYYQIVGSKCQLTRNFVTARTPHLQYALKAADGTITYQTTYVASAYAIAIDVSLLVGYGMGYSFSEGDLANIYIESASSVYTGRVLGQDGANVYVQLKDLGTFTAVNNPKALFRIYTPYKPAENEGYFDVTDIFNIDNAGTPARIYSSLNGVIPGDVYLLNRVYGVETNAIEAMSPLDDQWDRWNTNTGWVNQKDNIGQQRVKQEIRFSDAFQQGTKTNGLNKMQPLNLKNTDAIAGGINRLLLTQKVQKVGTVLLALTDSECFSIYLGESELFDTSGSAFIAKTENVLGNENALTGSMGTTNPESAFPLNGFAAWYDKRNASFVRYTNNGLFPISQNKFTRVANQLANDLQDDQVIIGGPDPYHKEYLFSVPSTTSTPPKGYLEDYEEMPYPYDVYSGRAKIFVYKPELDFWGTPFDFSAECFIRLGKDLYSISEGSLYLHNTASDKIYGKQMTSGVAITCNQTQGAKSFAGIGLEANNAPSFVHLRTEKPWVQSSDLVDEFRDKEGNLYAAFRRNRLDVNAGDEYFERQMKGEKMWGKSLLLYMTFDKKTLLKTSNINFTIKEGHFINT